jgi:hypothetical protein
MGDIWWVIIICPCVNVFSLMGGVTEADVGFPTGYDKYLLVVLKKKGGYLVPEYMWTKM